MIDGNKDVQLQGKT